MIEDYGVIPLTGEACRFSMRILCDLTEEGVKLIELYFGRTITCTRGSNWNNGDSTNPHVASIMLTHETFKNLIIFAEKCKEGADRNQHQMSGRTY